ncbi:MAG: geranylgeranylglycerol-phosphate geranylgeranyltransferase [Bacteroidetes bacterium]|nr:geranylgeranylglycerol-phosphate geranylgeranyltransferase [Bacteroidota bacterium]
MRPVNACIAGASVLLIPAISGKPWNPTLIGMSATAALAVMLIGAGGNVINDYYDVETDRINKPSRPLASGRVSRQSAFWEWLILSVSGVLLAGFQGRLCLGIAMVAVLALWVYSLKLKRTLLIGNAVVSLVAGMSFIYAGAAVEYLSMAWIPAVFAALFHFGREILKDIEDTEGDQAIGASTLPLVKGMAFSKGVATCVFFVLLVLTVVPYLTGRFGEKYLAIIIGLFFPIILFTLISLWRNSTKPNLHRLNNILKLAMIIGLFSIWVG